MPRTSSQAILRERDETVWTAADRLRSNLDAAVYNYAAHGLAQRRAETEASMKDPKHDFCIDPANLAWLIDLIATIPFQHADLHAKDILGHVYDWSGATKSLPKESPKGERGGAHQYFLGQFALAEGKKGGHWSGATKTSPQGSPKGWRGGANQYFTPKSIVSLTVEMIEPYQGRVYDPAMGSGGFFVQSERFIENRAERDRLAGRPARRVNAGAFINHGGTIRRQAELQS